MSFFRLVQRVMRAAGVFAFVCFAFSLIVWYAAHDGGLFILGFFGMKLSLGVIGIASFVRLIFAIAGYELVRDRIYEGLLWSGVVAGTVPGILVLMGGWMWFLVYPNWDVFLSYGLIGSVPAAVLGTAALARDLFWEGVREISVES